MSLDLEEYRFLKRKSKSSLLFKHQICYFFFIGCSLGFGSINIGLLLIPLGYCVALEAAWTIFAIVGVYMIIRGWVEKNPGYIFGAFVFQLIDFGYYIWIGIKLDLLHGFESLNQIIRRNFNITARGNEEIDRIVLKLSKDFTFHHHSIVLVQVAWIGLCIAFLLVDCFEKITDYIRRKLTGFYKNKVNEEENVTPIVYHAHTL